MAEKTYFFYDLETSGIDPRADKIMQFAGIRTDAQFQQIGEPCNVLVRLSEDTLPSPDALMVTGITPQKTVEEGHSEAEFARMFTEEIATPGTIMVGFNNIRFDDEFMRAFLWRNFYDPYKWAYDDGRGRWDLLDVVRMTRALRPEGINWPVTEDGKPTNRLELLSAQNGLEHTHAHDALSDVEALIGVTKLIADKQPQLFSYLQTMADKNEIKKLVSLEQPAPFVYSSGRYESEYEKTTVALPVAGADHGNVYVYDLRYDPAKWATMSKDELRRYIKTPRDQRDETWQRPPIKKLQYNRCPAVAPLGVLEKSGAWERIGLSLDVVKANHAALQRVPELVRNVVAIMQETEFEPKHTDAEAKLYDGFVKDSRDQLRAEAVRNASASDIRTMNPEFRDTRLAELFPRYKARNYPQTLSETERADYELYRTRKIQAQLAEFTSAFQRVSSRSDLSRHQQFVLQELQLWVDAIMPDTSYSESQE